MRQQSGTYDPFRAVRKVDFRIRFDLIDTEAKGNAAVSASSEEPFAAAENVLDDILDASGKWATLEKNLWTLDGSFDIMEASAPGNNGWWSAALSGDDGRFEDGAVELSLNPPDVPPVLPDPPT